MLKKQTPMKKKENNYVRMMSGTIMLGVVLLVLIIYLVVESSGRDTMYCHYERDLQYDLFVPRQECTILKIQSKDLNDVNWTKYFALNFTTSCAEDFEELPKCTGGTYHFAQFRLDNFCESRPCDIDGWVCGAYYVTYVGEYSNWRRAWEEGLFRHSYIDTEEEMLKMLDTCGSFKWGEE